MPHIFVDNVSMVYPTQLRKKHAKQSDLGVAGRLVPHRNGFLGVLALNNVSLKLKTGSRLGIIGANGSGKSTMLRLMAGIYTPTTGHVSVSGRISTMFSMGVGMQVEASGYRNIILSGLVAGATKGQIQKIIPDIIDFTELGDYLHLPIRMYSRGMAMRLKFACATAFQPEIVLLDEWIGAGDNEFRQKAEDRLDLLLQNSGIIVLATHNLKLMQSLATEVLWLEKGQVIDYGPTDEILEKRAKKRRDL